MNKKSTIIALVVSLVLVVAVVVLYSALKNYFRPVQVQSVNFVTEGTDYGDGVFDVGAETPQTSYQLVWKVLPEDAENKNVTFTSSHPDIKVSDTGLVTFTEPNISAIITIKTEDQEKTDTLTITTKSSKPTVITFDFETGILSEGDTYFIETIDGVQVLNLYNGDNYTYQVPSEFTMAEKTGNSKIEFSAKDANDTYLFTPKDVGETAIVISSGSESKTIKVKIIERVTMVTFDSTAEGILVGRANAYRMPLTIATTSGSNTGDVDYKLVNGDNEVVSGVTFTGQSINFGSTADGNYKIVATAHYNETVTDDLSIVLNAGYNVENHGDMLIALADTDVKIINVTKSYNIGVDDLAPSLIEEDNGVKYLTQSLEHDKHAIYTRIVGVTINGNGNTIDAGGVPIEVQFEWNSNGESTIGHSRSLLFRFGNYMNDQTYYYSTAPSHSVPGKTIKELIESSQPLDDEDKATQRAYVTGLYANPDKFVINNLNIEGNALDNRGTKITDREGHEDYIGYRTLNGIGANAIDLELNNVNIQEFLMGIQQANYSNGSFKLAIRNSRITNTFGYNVFTNRTASVILEDSTFGDAGFFAIYNKSFSSDKYIDGYTKILPTENVVCGVKLIGDVVFDNWIDAEEGTPFLFESDKLILHNIPTFITGVYSVDNISQVLKIEETTVSGTPVTKKYVNLAMQTDAASGEPADTFYDFTEATGYCAGYDTVCTNQTLQYVMTGSPTGQATGKDVFWGGFAGLQAGAISQMDAYQLIQDYSYATNSIVCCSVNIYLATASMGMSPMGHNSNSYFYLGANIPKA